VSKTEDKGDSAWILAVILAWVVPGLGHWYLGRRQKAVVFLVLILGLFLAGWLMTDRRAVNSVDTLPFAAQVLTGGVSLVAAQVGQSLNEELGPTDLVSAAYQSGTVYTLVAGLLNLLVILDAYIVANNIRRPTHTEPESDAEQKPRAEGASE
jgi:hypothetical protein